MTLTATTEPTADPIEVEQLHDIDGDGELSGRTNCWYCEGHVNPERFVRSVIDFVIEYGDRIPLIDLSWVRHCWLYKRPNHGGSWTADFRDEIPPRWRRRDWEAVTVLDCEQRRGGPRCSVRDCTSISSVGHPVMVKIEAGDSHTSADIWLCRRHSAQFPGPSYRVCMVPVGATIMLPAPGENVTP